jgi:hypothetical protein
MWLIHTQSLQLEEFIGVDPPPYAILSHTWDIEEVSFRDMINGPSKTTRGKKGYQKIKQTCRIARKASLDYAWVDTCCIDKSSSAELSEAINSMFQYYKRAKICYAYLSDLPSGIWQDETFAKCRWFGRGWTLQELLAPATVDFYDAAWVRVRTKTEATDIISQITGIDPDYLWHPGQIRHASVAVRLSWASGRTTTREEDMAYCLLGLFDINMPLLYGEGQKAFIRLQEEIVKRTNDLSLLAWKKQADHKAEYGCGVLASAPSAFRDSGGFAYGMRENEFSVTNKGIRITTQLQVAVIGDYNPFYILHIADDEESVPIYLVVLKLGRDLFVRNSLVGHGGLWDLPIQNIRAPLRTQSIHLAHDPSRIFTSASIRKMRQGSLELGNLRDAARGVKLFEVRPEDVWNWAESLLLDLPSAVLMLLGDPKEPYGSLYLLILQRRTIDSMYMVPASSPAIPYILSNLERLTRDELLAFWNLEPIHFERLRQDSSGDNQLFQGKGLDTGKLKIDLRASFRPVSSGTVGPFDGQRTRPLQLTALSIERPDSPPHDSAPLASATNATPNARPPRGGGWTLWIRK